MPKRKKSTINFFEIFDVYPREYFVFLFFFIFFFAIVSKTFSYTVIHHDFYSDLADRQQIGELELPVTRGSLLTAKTDTMTDGTIFATSVDLNDLAIDPQIEGNIEKLTLFLTEVLYEEMCYLTSSSDCYDDMLRFLKVLEIEDFEFNEEYITNVIYQKLRERFSQTRVTSVRLLSEISLEQEQIINSWNINGVYPGVNGLYVNPEELVQKEFFATKFTELFGGLYEDVFYNIRSRDLRYIPVFNKLSITSSSKIEEYIKDEAQIARDKADTIGGFIILTPHGQRIYPEGEIGSQITGFIDNSGTGRYGIEGFFDEILRGNPGEQVGRKDTKGRSIDPITYGNDNTDSEEGADIRTTIDRNIQKKIQEILKNGVEKYRANKGTIVVMEPSTGKIISLANYPSYDPNSPGEVYDLEKVTPTKYPNPGIDLLGRTVLTEDIVNGESYFYDGREVFLREATRDEYRVPGISKYIYRNSFGAGVYQNDAISSIYEPGSIMKAITVAIGIDTGEIQAFDRYQDNGSVTIDSFTISNVSNACLGYNTFTHALSYSCNVGMIRIVQRLGKAMFHKYLLDFGFGAPTGITLTGEVSTQIEPYQKWPTSKLLTSSYGLGVSVTPLQMASAYSVIANGGILMKPYIVDEIQFSDGKIITYEPQPVKRVLKETTSQTVTKMLVDGVDNGVAKNGAVEGYSVAGKTGTAQIAYRGTYETGAASTYGSFAGFAPAEDPQFVIIVKLDRPRTSQYGGETSAFIFAEVAEELLEYYGIPKKR